MRQRTFLPIFLILLVLAIPASGASAGSKPAADEKPLAELGETIEVSESSVAFLKKRKVIAGGKPNGKPNGAAKDKSAK